MAVMETIKIIYPASIVGLVGAGGLAAAVSTGGGLIQASATIIARNWVQKGRTQLFQVSYRFASVVIAPLL